MLALPTVLALAGMLSVASAQDVNIEAAANQCTQAGGPCDLLAQRVEEGGKQNTLGAQRDFLCEKPSVLDLEDTCFQCLTDKGLRTPADEDKYKEVYERLDNNYCKAPVVKTSYRDAYVKAEYGISDAQGPDVNSTANAGATLDGCEDEGLNATVSTSNSTVNATAPGVSAGNGPIIPTGIQWIYTYAAQQQPDGAVFGLYVCAKCHLVAKPGGGCEFVCTVPMAVEGNKTRISEGEAKELPSAPKDLPKAPENDVEKKSVVVPTENIQKVCQCRYVSPPQPVGGNGQGVPGQSNNDMPAGPKVEKPQGSAWFPGAAPGVEKSDSLVPGVGPNTVSSAGSGSGPSSPEAVGSNGSGSGPSSEADISDNSIPSSSGAGVKPDGDAAGLFQPSLSGSAGLPSNTDGANLPPIVSAASAGTMPASVALVFLAAMALLF
ncbi:uncharacterized protein MAM_01067 [Metarhizium album ARSEF 1941]|uniref:Uncharacterized protein n=1 Tax=Metarhizium album (strain ARSEF 1941) TaxID=1081103 RepID=A0A0B2X9R4_METAS|nr:uncharacterized protein MAM_01067 [Metarhizium album ARSEF 1941]KHO02066.1 hypothetical protein MAM_01067 [Metarhizium album ARSEF 1941]